jgi:hypothetical protein
MSLGWRLRCHPRPERIIEKHEFQHKREIRVMYEIAGMHEIATAASNSNIGKNMVISREGQSK